MAIPAIDKLYRFVALDLGANVETISATKTLTTADPQFQRLNGGVANRNVDLPAPHADNIGGFFFIYNSGATNNLAVRTSAGSTLATLLPAQGCVVVQASVANNWVVVEKSGAGAGGTDFGAPGLLTDVVGESTAAAGVTVDGLLLKDGDVRIADSDVLSFGTDQDITLTHDGTASVRVSNGAGSGLVELYDDTVRIVDDSDRTKQLAFQLSGFTTSTTRTWTPPDADLGSDQFVQKTTTNIANAAVRTLNATPVAIIHAPGAGKAIVDVRVSIKYVYATAAFDSVGAGDDLEIRYTDGSGAKVANDIETTGMLDQASDQYRMVGPVNTVLTPVANAAVVLRLATGEVYAAAGGGSLVVQAFYRIVTL